MEPEAAEPPGDVLREELPELFGPVSVDDRVRPFRVYALYTDRVPSPASYAEFEVNGEPVPVIIHNFRYYEDGMRRWDIDTVDLLVLDELHELTHWAMTEDERERFDRKARRRGRGDGYWLNRPLLDTIDWLSERPPEERTVGKPEHRSLLGRLREWLYGLTSSASNSSPQSRQR